MEAPKVLEGFRWGHDFLSLCAPLFSSHALPVESEEQPRPPLPPALLPYASQVANQPALLQHPAPLPAAPWEYVLAGRGRAFEDSENLNSPQQRCVARRHDPWAPRKE
eukprot:1732324-Rhodomonas_salina.2